jgi:mannose-6-phosphate isomerase-like protein (cupin superfamily)
MYVIDENDIKFIKLPQRKWKPLKDESGNTKTLLTGISEIQSGDKTPAHKHEGSEEVIYVLKGNGILHFPESDNNIYSGCVIYIPKNIEHCIESLGKGELRLFCVFSPPL